MVDIQANHGIGSDHKRCRWRDHGKGALAAGKTMHIKGTQPAAKQGIGRETCHFRLAAINHTQEGGIGKFDFSRSFLIYPDRVAGHDHCIDSSQSPVVFAAVFDQKTTCVKADTAVNNKIIGSIGGKNKDQSHSHDEKAGGA
jgi:hypothetical protein